MAVVAAAVDSPRLLETEEARGGKEEEEAEGTARRRLGEMEKGMEEKEVQEQDRTGILKVRNERTLHF